MSWNEWRLGSLGLLGDLRVIPDGLISELATHLRADLIAAMRCRDEVTVAGRRIAILAFLKVRVAGDASVEFFDEQVT